MTPVWRELYQTVAQPGLQTLQRLLRPLEVPEVLKPQILELLHPSEVQEALICDVAIAGNMEPFQSALGIFCEDID